MVLLRREAQLQGVNSVKVWECNSGCYDPSFYQQGGATVNGTYASLLDLPYLSDYKANPALDKLITDLGGADNFNNNAFDSYIMALLFQDAVNKAIANGADAEPRSRCSPRSTTTSTRSTPAASSARPTSATALGPTAQVLVQLQNGVWQRVDPAAAGHLRLQPGQRRDAQDERLVAVTACSKRRARSRRMASRGRRKSVGVVEMAHDLGVSTATISRALNGSPSVRRELADRIRAHAQARGYVANRLARALSASTSRAFVGFVIPYVDTPAYSAVAAECARLLSAAGTQMILAITENDAEREYPAAPRPGGHQDRGAGHLAEHAPARRHQAPARRAPGGGAAPGIRNRRTQRVQR